MQSNTELFDAVKDTEKAMKGIEERERKALKAVHFSFSEFFIMLKKLFSLAMLLYQRQNALEAEISQLKQNNLQKS